MPIIRRTRTRLVKTSCEDAWLCWLWLCGAVVHFLKVVVRLQSKNSFQKVHTAYTTAPHHSQHNQTSSHEVLTSLDLVLLMDIMMPETC
jgi:hypothetical protein